MTERPDRAIYGRRRAKDEFWIIAKSIRYVGDTIVYLADTIRDERRTPPPVVVHFHEAERQETTP